MSGLGPWAPYAGTSNITEVAASTGSVLLLAANYQRRQLAIVNFEAASNMYVSLGPNAASQTSFTFYLIPYGQVTPFVAWTGAVYAIWDGSPTGYAMITEFSQ